MRANVSEASENILKVREDATAIRFRIEKDSTVFDEGKPPPSWTDSATGRTALRSRIEPWLTALVQADHLNLLIGSGLTTAIHQIAGSESTANMADAGFSTYKEEITQAAQTSATLAGREASNLEDSIR